MIKLAIPTRGNEVDDHFGHCVADNIFTINAEYIIVKNEILHSP